MDFITINHNKYNLYKLLCAKLDMIEHDDCEDVPVLRFYFGYDLHHSTYEEIRAPYNLTLHEAHAFLKDILKSIDNIDVYHNSVDYLYFIKVKALKLEEVK